MYRQSLAQHQQIRTLIDQFESYLSPATPPVDPEAMAHCRWRLASLIFEHLALEDRTLYLPLERDPRNDVVTNTRRSKQELEVLFDRTQQHVKEWPTAVALGSWPEYCAVTRDLLKSFRARLSHEEAGPYLWVRTSGDIMAGQIQPHERNWVAPAWLVRDRIYAGITGSSDKGA